MSFDNAKTDFALVARNLTKTYRIYERPHHRLLQSLHRRGTYSRDFLALNDVSLQIAKGETIGIVGKNGSGKSTLLQIVCGIIPCTSGEVRVNGRIAAILELGAGFNSEFTGRENVLLGASLLGMSDSQAKASMAEVIAFAELEEFIDQPVKTYSSGMYIRLAFALAISVTPDILVIDEALAVGDEAFQRKCFAKIEQLKAAGCTLLFVSHSAGSITHLCDRAILLDGGRRLLSGAPKQVVAYYQKLIYATAEKRNSVLQEIAHVDSLGEVGQGSEPYAVLDSAQPAILNRDVSDAERFDPDMRSASTVELLSQGALISDVEVLTDSGKKVNVLAPGGAYEVVYKVDFLHDARLVNFGTMLKSVEGVELFGMTSNAIGDAIEFIPRGTTYRVRFRFRCKFLPGSYFVNAGCHGIRDDGEMGFLHRILDATMFRVEQTASNRLVRGFYDLSEEPACELAVIGQQQCELQLSSRHE